MDHQTAASAGIKSAIPSFTVADVAASLAFYRDVLGFTVHEKWEQDGKLMGLDLRAGDVCLFIGQDDFAKGRDRVKGVGHRIWFTTSDLDGLAAGILARGGTLDQPLQDRPWGGRDFAVADPDGFKLSFSTPMS